MKEATIFIQTFGDYPLIRVLDFLLYSRDFDYPITEIARNSGVHFQTFQKLWPRLVKEKIVIRLKEIKYQIVEGKYDDAKRNIDVSKYFKINRRIGIC